MATQSHDVEALIKKRYEHGFYTELESDTVPPGLDEDVICLISNKKKEPDWLLEWRLQAYRAWLKMKTPTWAHVKHAPIDYQAISYYSAPKSKDDGPKSLDQVDPKLLETYEKLGIPIEEQKALAGVAVDAVFDSVSIATTLQEVARRRRSDLLSVLRSGSQAS
jgi:Fe-S cluster assembly protein SufB